MSDWPSGMAVRPIQLWPGALASRRRRSDFSAPWSSTLALLTRELRALKAKAVVLQVAMQPQDFRNDGYPRAQAKAEHPGVILSLDSQYGPLSYPCDAFTTWQDNLRAIALALEALRKVDRYGVTKRGEQYTGWAQIESPKNGAMSEADALSIIRGLTPADRRGEPLERLVRWAKAGSHPDRHDGDRELWNRVEEAARVLGVAS